MRSILFFILIFLLPNCLQATLVKITLSDAIEQKLVSVTAINPKGKYTGSSLTLSVTNVHSSTLQIKVNPGIIFKPLDGSFQPLVLGGQELLVVQPKKTGSIDVQVFCGNAPLGCPGVGAVYQYAQVGSANLIKVLQFIKEQNLFDYLGQSAVWVITNAHGLDNIYDPERPEIATKLIGLLASLTNMPAPTYYAVHQTAQTPGQAAYNPKALKIIAKFEVLLDAPKTLSLGVYDETGTMIQKVFEKETFERKGHRFEVEFESENVPAGKYFIRLTEGSDVLQEKMVAVE